MTTIQRVLLVSSTPEECFTYVADFASCAEWDPGVATASLRDGSRVGIGAIYDVAVIFGSRRLPMVYEVTHWDPPNHVTLRGAGVTVLAVDDITFEPTLNGTRINYTADLRMRGVLAPITPLLRKKFEALGDAAMKGMAEAFRLKEGA